MDIELAFCVHIDIELALLNAYIFVFITYALLDEFMYFT
jgi:hypothetical protein